MKKLISGKKIIIIVVIIFLLVSLGIGKYYLPINKSLGDSSGSDKNTISVQTKRMLSETLNQYISVSAVTKPSREAKVNSKMTGNIASVYFEEGAWVNAGQTIIQLEKDRTLLVAYDNAQANLDNTLAAMKKDKEAAKVAVETSSGDNKKQAEANYSSVKKKAELQISMAQGQLDSIQAQLDNTAIVAPISGVMDQIYAKKGEMVMASSPVATIVNTEIIEIEVALTEFDISKTFVGQEAEINLAAYPNKKFTGEIYYVSSVADSKNKKFPVKLRLKNPDGKIKSGMIAQVDIIIDRQENILVVPKTAVFLDDNVEKVYLIDSDSRIKIVTVKTELLDNKLKVIEGLVENDEVVVDGNYELEEGEKVMIKN